MTVAAEEPRKIGAGIWEGEYDESYGTDDLVSPRRTCPSRWNSARARFLTRCSTPPRPRDERAVRAGVDERARSHRR